MGIFIGGVVIFGFICVVAVVSGLIQEHDRKAALAVAEKTFGERFGKIDHHFTRENACIGIDWANERLILGRTIEEAATYPLASVRDANVEIDGVNVTHSTATTKTGRGSQVAGGAAGAALLGPAGLLLGGLSGKSTTTGQATEERYIRSIKLVIRTADRAAPLRDIEFYKGSGNGVPARYLTEYLKKAAHFHALLMGAIEDYAPGRSLAVKDDGIDHDLVAGLERQLMQAKADKVTSQTS